jgi:hypothetical protein
MRLPILRPMSRGSIDDSRQGWRPRFRKNHIAILADEHNGSRDPIALFVQGTVRAGHLQILIDEKLKRKAILLPECPVAFRIILIDAQRLNVVALQRREIIAHGDKLITSAGRHILRIEHEQDVCETTYVRKPERLPGRIAQLKVRCKLTGLDQHAVAPRARQSDTRC